MTVPIRKVELRRAGKGSEGSAVGTSKHPAEEPVPVPVDQSLCPRPWRSCGGAVPKQDGSGQRVGVSVSGARGRGT